mgnify:FL=1|tara:strand:+ start:3238 stop:10242 length:7005 start_codon:yes stop_codon:yes gene_type:complete
MAQDFIDKIFGVKAPEKKKKDDPVSKAASFFSDIRSGTGELSLYEESETRLREEADSYSFSDALVDEIFPAVETPRRNKSKERLGKFGKRALYPEDTSVLKSVGIDTPTAFGAVERRFKKTLADAPSITETALDISGSQGFPLVAAKPPKPPKKPESSDDAFDRYADAYMSTPGLQQLAPIRASSQEELMDSGRGFLVPGEKRVLSEAKIMPARLTKGGFKGGYEIDRGGVMRGNQLLTPSQRLMLADMRDFEQRTGLTPLAPLNPGTFTRDDKRVEKEIRRMAVKYRKEAGQGPKSKFQKEYESRVKGGSALRYVPGGSIIMSLFVPEFEPLDIDENVVTADELDRLTGRGESAAFANLSTADSFLMRAHPAVAVGALGVNMKRILFDDSDSEGKIKLLGGLYGAPEIFNTAIGFVRPNDETGESGFDVLVDALKEYSGNPSAFIDDLKLYKIGDRTPDDWFAKLLQNAPADAIYTLGEKILIPLMVADGMMAPGPTSEKIKRLGKIGQEMVQALVGVLHSEEIFKVASESPFGAFLQVADINRLIRSKSGAAGRYTKAKQAYEDLLPELTEASGAVADAEAALSDQIKAKESLASQRRKLVEIDLPSAQREAIKYDRMTAAKKKVESLEREVARLERVYKDAKQVIDTDASVRERLGDELAAGKKKAEVGGALTAMRQGFSKFKKAARRFENLKGQARRFDVRKLAKESQSLFDQVERKRIEIAALEAGLDVDAPRLLQEFRDVRTASSVGKARDVLQRNISNYEKLIGKYNRAVQAKNRNPERIAFLKSEMDKAYKALDKSYASLSQIGREVGFGEGLAADIRPMIERQLAQIADSPMATVGKPVTVNPSLRQMRVDDVGAAARELAVSAGAKAKELRGERDLKGIREEAIAARSVSREAAKRLPEARKELRILEQRLKSADDLYYTGQRGVDVFASRAEKLDAEVAKARALMDEAKAELMTAVPQVYAVAGVARASDSVAIKRAIQAAEEIVSGVDAPFLTDQFSSAVKAIEGQVRQAERTGRRAKDDYSRDFDSRKRVAARIARQRKLMAAAKKAYADAMGRLFVSARGKGLKQELADAKKQLKEMSGLKPGTRDSRLTPDELNDAMMQQFEETREAYRKGGRDRFRELSKRSLEIDARLRQQEKDLADAQIYYSDVKQQLEPILEKDKLLREQLAKAEGLTAPDLSDGIIRGVGRYLNEPVSLFAEQVLTNIVPFALSGGFHPFLQNPMYVLDTAMDLVRLTDSVGPRRVREAAARELAKDPKSDKARKRLRQADILRFALRAPENRLAQAYIDAQYESAITRDRKVLHLQRALQELGDDVKPTANMWLHMEHSVGDQVRLPESNRPIFSLDPEMRLIDYVRSEDGRSGQYVITEAGKDVASKSNVDARALQEQLDIHNSEMKPLTDKLTEISSDAADLGLIYDPQAGRPLWFPQVFSERSIIGSEARKFVSGIAAKVPKLKALSERIRFKQDRLIELQEKLYKDAINEFPELIGGRERKELLDPQAAAAQKLLEKGMDIGPEAELRAPEADTTTTATAQARDRSRLKSNILRRAAKLWEVKESARVNAETNRLISRGKSPDSFQVKRRENPYSIEQREAAGLATDIAKQIGAGVNRFLETVQQHDLYRRIARSGDKLLVLTKRQYDALPAERKAMYELPQGGFMDGTSAEIQAGKIPTSMGELNGILERVVDPDTGRTVNKWRQRKGDEILYVNRDVIKEMEMVHKFSREMEGLWPELTRKWKFGKTALSPTTALRNFWSNVFVFAPKDGISPFNPANMKYYIQIIKDLMKPVGERSEMYNVSFESGVFRGNQARVELASKLDSLLPGQGGVKNASDFVSALLDLQLKESLDLTVENAGRLYSAIDDIFRGASAYKKLDNFKKTGNHRGITSTVDAARQIAKESRKNYVDYEQVNGLVQILRNPVGPGVAGKAAYFLGGRPFIAFTAGAVPMMRNWYSENPLKATMYSYLMNQLTQQNLVNAGHDPAMEDFIAYMLPAYEKAYGVNVQSLLPLEVEAEERDTIFGKDKARYFLNTSWVNPWSFLLPSKVENSWLGNGPINYAVQMLLGEAPVIGAIRDIALNYDTFRHRPITKEYDTADDVFIKRAQYFIDSLTPSWTPEITGPLRALLGLEERQPGDPRAMGGAISRRLTQAEEGRLTKRGLPVSDTQSALYMLGLNLSQSDEGLASEQLVRKIKGMRNSLERSFAANEMMPLEDIKADPKAKAVMDEKVVSDMVPGLKEMYGFTQKIRDGNPVTQIFNTFVPIILDSARVDGSGKIADPTQASRLIDRMTNRLDRVRRKAKRFDRSQRSQVRQDAVENASNFFTN